MGESERRRGDGERRSRAEGMTLRVDGKCESRGGEKDEAGET